MFSSTISKIWLVGLLVFALTPFLISRTTTANNHLPASEKIEVPAESAIEKLKGDNRDPAAVVQDAALAK